jgi:UDP-glucose 4-epimerase
VLSGMADIASRLNIMVQIIAGGAGFIGSHLTSALLAQGGTDVVVLDNLSRGRTQYLGNALATGRCRFIEVDCADPVALGTALKEALSTRKAQAIWHMAANSDIPAGVADPRIDLRDTFMTTFNLLAAMREIGASRFYFASSSAVYGDFGDNEIHEDSAPCRPISNYGAMKLASEAQISAALECFGEKAAIFRFPNVVGAPATHGVIFDFIRKLRADPARLTVLGDGTQQKAYLHVSDLVEAMLFIAAHGKEKFDVYNIGPRDDGVTVRFIAQCVVEAMSPHAQVDYGFGDKGWVGDVPKFRYSTDRLASLGWRPKRGSAAAICLAVDEIERTI